MYNYLYYILYANWRHSWQIYDCLLSLNTPHNSAKMTVYWSVGTVWAVSGTWIGTNSILCISISTAMWTLKRNLMDMCLKQNFDAPKMAASKSIIMNWNIKISIEIHLDNILKIYQLSYQYCYLPSTLPEIDPDTAYVVCIPVSLGFPYMVSVFSCFPYMVSICPHFLIW